MGGHSGTAVASHTQTAKIGGQRFAVSHAQRKLLSRTILGGGGLFVKGGEVRTARALSMFGELRDEGALSPNGAGNPDGERWFFTLKEGVSLA